MRYLHEYMITHVCPIHLALFPIISIAFFPSHWRVQLHSMSPTSIWSPICPPGPGYQLCTIVSTWWVYPLSRGYFWMPWTSPPSLLCFQSCLASPLASCTLSRPSGCLIQLGAFIVSMCSFWLSLRCPWMLWMLHGVAVSHSSWSSLIWAQFGEFFSSFYSADLLMCSDIVCSFFSLFLGSSALHDAGNVSTSSSIVVCSTWDVCIWCVCVDLPFWLCINLFWCFL